MDQAGKALAAFSLMLLAAGCGDTATVPEESTFGPNPVLPEPVRNFIPTVNLPPKQGWPEGGKPVPGPGLLVNAFASGLAHPRWLYVLPNGDVLVAETSAPPRPEDEQGLRGILFTLGQYWAGVGAASANRITLLRDGDGDGVAESRTIFLKGLNSPLGMALIGHDFYIANTDAVLLFPYAESATQIDEPGVKICDLPAGPLNHHWVKNIVASSDGTRLYASIGSNSDAGENGLDREEGRAAIWEIDLGTGQSKIFASGLRNPVGMAWQPETGTLWTVVNERDEMGSDLVPDFLTSVREGAFYGWPFSYFGQHLDPRVSPQNPGMVAKALAPDYALGNHTSALGLAFSSGPLLLERYRNGAFIGLHGSWNRKPRSGYKVIFVPFVNGQPSGQPLDVLTGFVSAEGKALGRPAGVAIDRAGALLVADDVGNSVWRVTPAAANSPSEHSGID